MFLPIRLIWNLQMERPKKIGCGLLFASGLVCILFSTIRIVQVGQDGKPRSPDPKWLTMWTIIECSTGKTYLMNMNPSAQANFFSAVIIGCCPVLASVVPKGRLSNRISYDTQGYVRQSPNRSTHSHRLRDMLSSKSREKSNEKTSENISMSRTGHESVEELPERRKGGTGILITAEMREQHELRMEEDRMMDEARLRAEQAGV
jgi:hypothetical protein